MSRANRAKRKPWGRKRFRNKKLPHQISPVGLFVGLSSNIVFFIALFGHGNCFFHKSFILDFEFVLTREAKGRKVILLLLTVGLRARSTRAGFFRLFFILISHWISKKQTACRVLKNPVTYPGSLAARTHQAA